MKGKPARPMARTYRLLCGVGAFVLRLLFGYRRTGETLPREGPLLVVASHQGMLDFLAVAAALPGRVVRFVATRRFFRRGLLRAFLRVDGAIPKTQGYADPACVHTILRALRAGETVGLFPAGQTSMCGLPMAVAPALARLVKRAGAPVCAVRLHGGFCSLPRHRPSRPCFGRMEAEVRLLLTREQLAQCSEEEIYRALVEGIAFDEGAWQARTGARFLGGHRADGLERVLWKCPRCGAEGALLGRRAAVRCRACGAEAAMGRDHRFAPPFPATVSDWYRLQEEALRLQMAEPAFALEVPARLESWEEPAFVPRGGGTLRLDREGLHWRGPWDGAPCAITVRHEAIAGLTVEGGRHIEVHAGARGLLRLTPDDPAAVPKLKQAQELLTQEQAREKKGKHDRPD